MNMKTRAGYQSCRGQSFLDVVVTIAVLAMSIAVLLPSVRASEEQSARAVCLSRAVGMASSLRSYAADHAGRMPGDTRDSNPNDDWDVVRLVPDSELGYAQSWLGQAESYLPTDPSDVDCPIVDDQRKTPWWQTDYVINRWGIGMNPDTAAEPGRAVLVTEPNMQRGAVTILADVVAWSDWGTRADLEQNQVGSVSFVFVDGHGARVTIPQGASPHLAQYSEIYMANPGGDYLTNCLWWTQQQQMYYGQ